MNGPSPTHIPSPSHCCRNPSRRSRLSLAQRGGASAAARGPTANGLRGRRRRVLPPYSMPPKGESKDVYEVHRESFDGESALILCRRQPGPCPLLGLCNFLLLRQGGTAALDTVKRTDGTRYVSFKKLQGFVLDLFTPNLAESARKGSMSSQERDRLLKEYKAQLEELRSGIGLYECFSSIDAFVSAVKTPDDLFIPLAITRRHALIPDPVKDACLYNAIKDESLLKLYQECTKYKAGFEKGEVYEPSYHDKMNLIKDFVFKGPLFTKYGLDRLREEALEKELSLLLLNGDLHVVYKRDGQLYLLATEEDVRVKHPDIMWFGLDENFNAENPAETTRKFTNTFIPINENWASSSDQLLKDLEEEKRRETAVSKVVAVSEPAGRSSLVDDNAEAVTVDSHKVDMKRPKVAACELAGGSELVDDSAEVETIDIHKDDKKKRPKIEVDRRFLRFIHRRVLSFNEFTSYYMMYKIYHFKGQHFLSTSHLGRLMGKGYLVFILDVHKSGYAWNGTFKEEDMMVELELVDGSAIGAINFFITLTAYNGFNKKNGEADLENFDRIVFPRYLCDGFEQLPCYFQRFRDDIKDMPDCSDPPEKLEKFQKYMKDHFFAKAPLVRSTIVSDLYGLCNSEIVHVDTNSLRPRYGPLDVEVEGTLHELTLLSSLGQHFCEPLKQVYLNSRVEIHITGSRMCTIWDLLALGRHSKQHLMDKTQEDGVQQMDDPVLIDLIMEHDLNGQLTEAIKVMMDKTKFEGRFQTTWQHFSGSEPKDDGDRIPLLFGDEDVVVAEDLDGAGMQTAATVAGAESLARKEPEDLDGAGMQTAATVAGAEPVARKEPERYIINDFEVKLSETGFRSLEGRNWILDEAITFAYYQLKQDFMDLDDFHVVMPNVAHALAHSSEGSVPFNPGENNMFLFPVNNSMDHERGDVGTHWSLVALRIDRRHNECIFVHHDRSQNTNQAVADCLVGYLEKLFPTFHSRYEQDLKTPQQVNGYDCGMYVICFSHKIASWYKRVKDGKKVAEDWTDEVSKITSEFVSKSRQKVYVSLKKKFRMRYPGYFEEESSNQGGAVE